MLDEYGKFVGLVTLERSLGEMVGDIDEEFIRSGKRWKTFRMVPCASPA
ncbi:MAG: hypothetical protein ACLT8E_04650 [Akkermansia sp.]